LEKLGEPDISIVKTDVLVIGGGGAGMRAAIEAASRGCEVIVTNKGPVGRSGTTPMAMEAYQAVCLPGDSPEIHFRDAVEGGRFLGDEGLIEILVTQALERARDLESFGVRFKRKPDGTFDPMHHPGQTYPRTLFIQGGGFGMLRGLVNQAQKCQKVRTLSDVLVVKLLQDQDGVPGAAVYLDLKDGRMKAILCKAVIIATGGYEELWAFNDASSTACGDGLFLAYEAGAESVDLEMLQFHPTIVIYPSHIKGILFQYELVIHPEYLAGRLLNGKGETFFEGFPLRDAIIRAIWGEIKAGRGTEHGGVSIDLTRSKKNRQALTEALEKWQPNQFHYLQEMGVDLRDKLVEVAPHGHFNMGGVAIDEKTATAVPGLFAAGEVAGNLHGANRISGNALAETQVFGALAGQSAAAFARNGKFREAGNLRSEVKNVEQECRSFLNPEDHSLRPFRIRRLLQETMWKGCGIERESKELSQGMEKIKQIERDLFPRVSILSGKNETVGPYPQELQEAWELKMMVTLAGLVMSSALSRKETRGHHMRSDYPETEKEARHVFLSKGKGLRMGAVKRISR
jgi:succinate dehydrogenase/fumarate reductase flavoprotein subunit